MMNILNIHPQLEDIYNEGDFLVFIESHLEYLRKNGNIQAITIGHQESYKYEGDFYGILNNNRIDAQYHYLVLRTNGYESPLDYKGDVKQILIPDFSEFDMLKQIYQTKKE